jgi:hypothetical protein
MFGRRRPLLRGAVVGGAAYHIGKNRAQQQAQQDQAQADDTAQQAQADEGSKGGESSSEMDKITKLQKLHDNGALTDEEFTQAKKKVIAEM